MTILSTQSELIRGPEIEEPVLEVETKEKPQESVDRPALTSLTLSIQLRSSLSKQDRTLWNKLAPSDRTLFLVRGGRFVHPEKFNTFPLEQISGDAGDHALFSHRFRPNEEHSGQASIIQTAVLNPGGPNPLMFGWFGSEITSVEGGWDHRFSQLVADLRRAYSESAPIAERLQTHLGADAPTLIVDRMTGRMLRVNQAAADLCGQNLSAMANLRFEQVRKLLGEALVHRRLNLRRINVGDIKVTVMTLTEVESLTHTTTGFVADFLVHPSQQKLAGIIMAAELLKSTLSEKGDADGIELSDIIAGEARELDDLIGKQVLLLEDIDDTGSYTSLIAQTELAIDSVNKGRKLSREIVINDLTEGRHQLAPGRAFTALAEAILKVHAAGPEKHRATSVTFEPDENSDDIIIRFETQGSEAGGADSDLWIEYAQHLATRLGFEQFSHELIGRNLIRTDMRSNPNKVLEKL